MLSRSFLLRRGHFPALVQSPDPTPEAGLHRAHIGPEGGTDYAWQILSQPGSRCFYRLLPPAFPFQSVNTSKNSGKQRWMIFWIRPSRCDLRDFMILRIFHFESSIGIF